MENFINKLREIEDMDLTVVNSRGSLSLQQTQRNQIKAELLDALYEDMKLALKEEGFGVYITGYGPVIEVLNQGVEDQVFKMEEDNLGSGFISIQLDAVMKNLDTNAEVDEESYLHDKEQKELRAAEKERAKQAKTQRDAEARAEKARQREEAIARIQARKD